MALALFGCASQAAQSPASSPTKGQAIFQEPPPPPHAEHDANRAVATGWSYCSRECGGDYQCNAGICLGNTSATVFTCRPRCASLSDSSCPGECDYAADSSLYCSCPDCEIAQGALPLGVGCQSDSECASGDCYAPRRFCNDLTCWSGEGLCSTTCGSDDVCGEGLVCADIPCAPGESVTCGVKCLPRCPVEGTCDRGVCRTLLTAAGATVGVCDTKAPDRAECLAAEACQSGNCVEEVCLPAG